MKGGGVCVCVGGSLSEKNNRNNLNIDSIDQEEKVRKVNRWAARDGQLLVLLTAESVRAKVYAHSESWMPFQCRDETSFCCVKPPAPKQNKHQITKVPMAKFYCWFSRSLDLCKQFLLHLLAAVQFCFLGSTCHRWNNVRQFL